MDDNNEYTLACQDTLQMKAYRGASLRAAL